MLKQYNVAETLGALIIMPFTDTLIGMFGTTLYVYVSF